MIDELVIYLSQDIGVEPFKLMELSEIGLNFPSQLKYFVYFQMYYHFDDFVRIMARHNVALEEKALKHLMRKEKGENGEKAGGDKKDDEIARAI